MMAMNTDQELLSKSANVICFEFKYRDRKRDEAEVAAEWPLGKL
jgi:hypothetical protein